MNSTCEWKPSAVFPGYYDVSSAGEVYSKKSNKIIRPNKDKHGYLYYVLCVNGDRRTVKAHRLVAQTFISNPENKPCIDHINGVRDDNRVENLRWVTPKENSHNERTLTKLRANAALNMPTLLEKSIERDFGRTPIDVWDVSGYVGRFPSQRAASKYTGISTSHLSQCISGKKSCKGYIFKKAENYNG